MFENLTSNETLLLQDKKEKISFYIRILLSALFIVSAVAKIYPSPNFALGTFELKQLVDGLGFSPSTAAWFSRFLVGTEFALGFALLQRNHLRKLVIPLSIILLAIFCIHLSYEIATKGNNGNCGCFGSLLPMTPLQAILKNVIAIAALAYVLRLHKKYKIEDKKKAIITWSLAVLPILAMYIIAPMGGKSVENNKKPVVVKEDQEVKIIDTTKQLVQNNVNVIDTVKVEKPLEPKAKKSGYANLFSDIDKGKKLLCFFAPGCEHCQKAAKEITQLKKKIKDFPQVRIVFMDEEVEKIPDFFTFAGAKYTYNVADVVKFWTVFKGDTPGVYYFWNGNQQKYYQGTEESNPTGHFVKSDLEKSVNQLYKGK